MSDRRVWTPTITQTTHANNAPNKTLHHHKLGEEAKEAVTNCAVIANVVPRQEPQPAASPSSYPKSSTMELSPSSRTNTIIDPSAPVVRQQNTPVVAPMNTTDPGLSAWGPHLFHRLTLLTQHNSSPAHRAPPAPPLPSQHGRERQRPAAQPQLTPSPRRLSQPAPRTRTDCRR